MMSVAWNLIPGCQAQVCLTVKRLSWLLGMFSSRHVMRVGVTVYAGVLRRFLLKETQTSKKKVKRWSCPCALTEHHAMQAYRGSGGVAPFILWPRQVVSFTTRPLYPQRKSPWYPLERRLSGPQSRFGRVG